MNSSFKKITDYTEVDIIKVIFGKCISLKLGILSREREAELSWEMLIMLRADSIFLFLGEVYVYDKVLDKPCRRTDIVCHSFIINA